jgi:hypothetical protein
MRNDTKVPDPYEKNQSVYFNRGTDGGIRCVGAALSLDSQTHVIVCAPDIVALKRAWGKMTGLTLDVKKSQVLLYKYEPEKPEFKAPIEGKNLGNIMEVKNNRISQPYMWYIHPESGCCFIDFEGQLSSDRISYEIGPAIKMTVIECKLLLRSLGWKREDIDKLTIDTTDPIPF